MNIEDTKKTLNYLLDNNLKLVDEGKNKLSINLVGAAGLGKTSIVQQVAEARGAQYTKLCLAEYEDTGDITGFPIKEYLMITPEQQEELWVAEKAVDKFIAMGYTMCPTCMPRMSYAAPAWVPKDEGQEAILCLDDWTRCAPIFMQAIMSLLQFGEYGSWKLPKKCHIILTSNPSNGDYNITSEADAAVQSRMINFDVDFDINVFAKWMEEQNMSSSLINFPLLVPEIFSRAAHINPRSYTMFANAISSLPNFDSDKSLEMVCMIAKGCFGDDWVSGQFVQFIHNKLDKLIDPKDMLNGEWKTVKERLEQNIYKENKYQAAIASTLTVRFTNYVENYFNSSTDKKKSEKVIDRIIELCTDTDKTLLTEDLIYKMVKGLNAKYPQRCTKMLKYPQIRGKLL